MKVNDCVAAIEWNFSNVYFMFRIARETFYNKEERDYFFSDDALNDSIF
jgi:hypothetical protein